MERTIFLPPTLIEYVAAQEMFHLLEPRTTRRYGAGAAGPQAAEAPAGR